MPISTSPYQNNDYGLLNFRPSKLPSENIFRAISAQDSYWMEGASRVKNQYDNALDLKLRTTENRQHRDSFIKDAEMQLSKLSSQNLADRSVQRKGFQIFEPLMKDTNIVGEDHVVRHLENEIALGQSFRMKDNGKEYNPLSIENMRYEEQLLTTPQLNHKEGWKALYNSMSSYTPYTDTTEEYKNILELAKAEERKSVSLQGEDWYKHTVERKGVSKDRILSLIQEVGSPQLKEQMRVEGRNTFYKKLSSDPIATDSYFQNLASSYYSQRIGEMKQQRDEAYTQAYLTSDKTPEGKLRKEQYLDRYNSLKKQVTDAETKDMPEYVSSFSNLSDLNNLGTNLSKIDQLWQASSTERIASRMAYESVTEDIEANPVKIAQENINMAMRRHNLDIAQYKQQLVEFDHQQKKDKAIFDEDVRQFDATNKRLWADMLYGGKDGKDRKGTGSSANVLAMNKKGEISLNYSTSQPGTLTPEDEDKRIKALMDYMNERDEPLREAAISNIVSPDAWAAMQENLSSNPKVGEGNILLPHDMDRAAKFFKAFTAKGGQAWSGNVLINSDMTEDQIKSQLATLSVRDFKKLMGELVKNNPETSTELLSGMAADGKPAEAVNFRTIYNETITNQLNLSENINRTTKKALGDLSQYFAPGKEVLTDENIRLAYEKAKAKGDVYRYVKVKQQEGWGAQNIPVLSDITKEEYEKELKSPSWNTRVEKVTADPDQFKQMILNRTRGSLARLATEHNLPGQAFVFNKDNVEEKVATLQLLEEKASADLQGTDATSEKKKELFEYMRMNPDKVMGYKLNRVRPGESLPTVTFQMHSTSGDKEDAMVGQVNNTEFRVSDVPSVFYQQGDGSDQYRGNRGWHIADAIVRSPRGDTGNISVINTSTDPSRVGYHIDIKNVHYLYLNHAGVLLSQPITPEIVEQNYKKRTQGRSLQDDVDTNPIAVKTILAEMATKIELENRKLKEEYEKKQEELRKNQNK